MLKEIFKKIKGILRVFKSRTKVIQFKPASRVRLKVLYEIETDKAWYVAYNTEPLFDDAVYIEIEENHRNGDSKIILEKELFDDSWNGLAGCSFGRLVMYSRDHLLKYIENNNEQILEYEKRND